MKLLVVGSVTPVSISARAKKTFYGISVKAFMVRDLPILKSWKCLYCANRQYERKRYDKPIDIPCTVSEIENRDLDTCPIFKKYVPLRARKNCPNCGADIENIKHHRTEGERVCHVCGFVVDDKTWGQLGKGTRTRGYYG